MTSSHPPALHVALVITKGELGGAQTHVLELCQSLRHAVRLSVLIGGNDARQSPLAQSLQTLGVQVHGVPQLGNSLNLWRVWRAMQAVVAILRDKPPDVLHAHSAVAGVISRLAGHWQHWPVVYTVHGFGFKPQSPWRIRWSAWLAEHMLAAWTTRMVCVSHHERSLASDLPLPQERIDVIPNSLQDSPWRAQADAEPAQVMMVARLAAPKRPDLLLQALALLARQGVCPPTQILGDGPLRAPLEAMRERTGLHHVQFRGDVQQVPERLAQCQVLVLLSDHEGMPITLIEGMRAGLPIVASKLPGIEEMITHGQEGLLVDGQAASVAAALQILLAHPELRARMGQAARERYERHFHTAAQAKALLRIYREAPLQATARWPMTRPRPPQQALAGAPARQQQRHLLWSLGGLLGIAFAWLLSQALQSIGWATHVFSQTVLASVLPYAVAAHLLYHGARLPLAERRSVMWVTTTLPYVLMPLGFAIVQSAYSRGAVLLTWALTCLLFWVAERWLHQHRPLKLLCLDEGVLEQVQDQLSPHERRTWPVRTVHWPEHWTFLDRAPDVDAVLLDPLAQDDALRRARLIELKRHHLRLYSPDSLAESLTGRIATERMAHMLWQPEARPAYDLVKRLLDLVLVLGLMPLWLPLGLLVGVAVRLDSPGPAVFVQWRTGRYGQPFRLFKFRSMRHSRDTTARFAQDKDPRITRLGQFIRKTRLDEIPQLWNVLRGQMSLIGPRPEQLEFVRQFASRMPSYPYRHLVRPGLTGWAQVQQGYAASEDETLTKLGYDLYYVSHYSLAMDLLIAFKTVRIVLTGHGAR